jgi:hypothetical protein
VISDLKFANETATKNDSGSLPPGPLFTMMKPAQVRLAMGMFHRSAVGGEVRGPASFRSDPGRFERCMPNSMDSRRRRSS